MSKPETNSQNESRTGSETPTVEELIQRAANGDEDAVDLLSVNEDALAQDGGQTTDDTDNGNDDGPDAVDRDARLCGFCGSALSSQSTWSYAGKDTTFAIRGFLCPECRLDGRGSVTEVEIDIGDDAPHGIEANIAERLDKQHTKYGVAQSTRQPALGLGPDLPNGTYHFVRIDPYTVEFRPFVDVDLDTLKEWTSRWDWTENVEIVPARNEDMGRPVLLFRDVYNGPHSRRNRGPS